ncbi:leucine-rich repeat and IQ domain-containing protein [Pimephales promelas]|nr:leucine-rich repeat and IQ domain-containing protein [Pimephales promelas]
MNSLKAHWDYLVNCSQSLILDHGYWTLEGEKDPKDIVMVRLSSLLLKSLDQIEACRAMRICILADNFLTRIEALMACTRLVKLDLKGNQIVQLPDASCWSNLRELQLLYLHDNNMSTWDNVEGLSGCLNLTALTLYDTPLSLKKNYRHCLVNNIWSLKALDNFVISDEEIIQNWSLPLHFKAMKQHFCVSLYPSTKSDSFETEMKAVYKIITEINRIQAFYSPTLIVQRWIRGHLIRKSLGRNTKETPKKHTVSGKPLISTPLVRAENEQQQPSQSQKTMEEDTDDNHELVYEEATNAESFDGQQGTTVPYNSPKCRSLKSEVQISTFEDTNVNGDLCHEEIEEGTFHVLGLKALVHQSEPLSDMLWSRKAVGQDIREAFSHFHTQRPGQQTHSPAIASVKRLVARCHDNISLTPFKVIERAHQSFDKARIQKDLAEKVTEHHVDHEVAKGRRFDFMEARKTDVRLRHEREKADMEKTLIIQRAKLERDVHHARQKHAQFLEEKRRTIQEQKMVCQFSQRHISLARAALRYNTWKCANQQ